MKIEEYFRKTSCSHIIFKEEDGEETVFGLGEYADSFPPQINDKLQELDTKQEFKITISITKVK